MRSTKFVSIVALWGAVDTTVAIRLSNGWDQLANAEQFNSQGRLWIDDHITQLFNEQRNISVIVVGANDGSTGGETNDPMIDALMKTNVKALMIEPNPPVYKSLEQNLKQFPESTRLHPLNLAICANVSGSVPFYVVSPRFAEDYPNAPHWARNELSSMDRKNVLKHWNQMRPQIRFRNKHQFAPYIDEIQVPCWTPSDLMSNEHFKPEEVDFLQVDAEGFDDKIVAAFMAQEAFAPRLVIYEYKHLSEAAADEVKALLARKGYAMKGIGNQNMIAWKQ